MHKKFHDLTGLLQTHPEGWCLWQGYKAYESSNQFQRIFDYLKSEHFTLSDLMIHLEGESATQLEASFHELIEKDNSFSLRIKCGHKNAIYLIKGTRLQSTNRFVTWVRDVTEQVHSQKIVLEASERNEKLLSIYENILNAMPFPIWRRNQDLKLDYCNQAYQNALEASFSEVIKNQLELIPKGQGQALANEALAEKCTQEITTLLIIEEECKVFTIREIIDPTENGTFGFALDINDLEKLQKEKEAILLAYHNILDHLSTAVGIYDADRRLTYYNRAYLQMNHLEEKYLKGNPRLDDVLEVLREKRALPEYADFPAYKKQRIMQFQDLIKPQEELIHRPDERTLRMFTAPYPLGGLVFMFEDVTDNLSLIRKNNALVAVQRTTLDNLFEGVAVFGPDNRLTLTNSSFRKIWNLREDQCTPGDHLSDIIEHIRPFFSQEENWPLLKNRIIENTTDRVGKRGQILRSDSSVIEFTMCPFLMVKVFSVIQILQQVITLKKRCVVKMKL
ncbi:PAS domain-containing sensor histidine kinase [Candidatus Bealeia paramacronuclearis]|uniref:PAS domain-containing sensor histidine kinase n=1 Tax=Candidatus Bealeia paramacronuclearis TaxID=1921001 RepID=A0ABZ2C2P7_9PROT|nr:PAS domain-containing sensor histidine kinase [Candidatus Bealeia paramacronuclearis]